MRRQVDLSWPSWFAMKAAHHSRATGNPGLSRAVQHGFGRTTVMKSLAWEGMLRFWKADRGLSIILAMLVFIIFVLPTLQVMNSKEQLTGDVAFSALLIAGAFAETGARWVHWLVMSFASAALLVRVVVIAVPSETLIVVREASTLITLLLFALIVAARVYRRGPVTHHRIQGAVAVLLLLGLVWAHAYQMLHVVLPAAFHGEVGTSPGLQTWIYYSFSTLTTVGYGDITPIGPIARSLSIAEALVGQLYLTIMLARLVTLHVSMQDTA
jgi:hypothetical protein